MLIISARNLWHENQGGGVGFHKSRTVMKTALSLHAATKLVPWTCYVCTVQWTGTELLPTSSLCSERRKESKNTASPSPLFSSAPAALMLHQGGGVLRFWLRCSQDRAGGRLGSSSQPCHSDVANNLHSLKLAGDTWAFTRSQASVENSKQKARSNCCMRSGPFPSAVHWWGGGKGRQSSTKILALTPQQPLCVLPRRTDISQVDWVSALNVAASSGTCQVSGRLGPRLWVRQAYACGCPSSGFWWPL